MDDKSKLIIYFITYYSDTHPHAGPDPIVWWNVTVRTRPIIMWIYYYVFFCIKYLLFMSVICLVIIKFINYITCVHFVRVCVWIEKMLVWSLFFIRCVFACASHRRIIISSISRVRRFQRIIVTQPHIPCEIAILILLQCWEWKYFIFYSRHFISCYFVSGASVLQITLTLTSDAYSHSRYACILALKINGGTVAIKR